MTQRVFCSAAPLPGGKLPTEFLIFRRGVTRTSKGDFVLDDKAITSVMAKYRKQGVELPIDLEHESLDAPTRPDSRDARGWFKLEVRNGNLFAVGVTWTPDGARRLSDRTQRYISPAFLADESGRIAEILNVALVAQPATYGAASLVAAGRLGAASSTMLGARVPNVQADHFRALAKRNGVAPGVWLRRMVELATSRKGLLDIAKFAGLEIDPKAFPEEIAAAIHDAVDALLAEDQSVPPGDGGLRDPLAASPPPKGGTGTQALSREQTTALAARGLPQTRLVWNALKAAQCHRAGE